MESRGGEQSSKWDDFKRFKKYIKGNELIKKLQSKEKSHFGRHNSVFAKHAVSYFFYSVFLVSLNKKSKVRRRTSSKWDDFKRFKKYIKGNELIKKLQSKEKSHFGRHNSVFAKHALSYFFILFFLCLNKKLESRGGEQAQNWRTLPYIYIYI